VRGLRQWMPLSAMSLMHCRSESTVHFHKIQGQFFSPLYFMKHDNMWTFRGVAVQVHGLLTPALNEGENSDSHTGRFTYRLGGPEN